MTELNNDSQRRVIVIPARLASTRLPNKPLQKIGSKSLIQWVYERACTSCLCHEVLVATDSDVIADVVLSFGGKVVMTAADLRSGTDRVHEALHGREADLVVNLQCDEPFIDGAMIDALFAALMDGRAEMVTLCTSVSGADEYDDPNTVKVVLDSEGFALYFSRSPIPYVRGPQPPSLYKHIGIYGFTRDFLKSFVAFDQGVLERSESLEQLRALEKRCPVLVLSTVYEGFGIDTERDLEKARTLLA